MSGGRAARRGLLAAVLILSALSCSAVAQDGEFAGVVGEDVQWKGEGRDSLLARASARLDSLRRIGHYFARIDTIYREGDEVTARIDRGPLVEIGALEIRGAETGGGLLALMDTQTGNVLHLDVLERDIARLLAHYEREGRPLASLSIEELDVLEDERMRIVLQVDPGPLVRLKRIDLPGAARTKPGLIARIAGFRIGDVLRGFDAESLRRRLEEADLFQDVGTPELVVEPDSGAVIRIPVDEGDPGTFDLVLGYLPPQAAGSGGSIIGNGRLELRNVFGGGRRLAARFNRLPGQTSSMELRAADPYVSSLPIGVSGSFFGIEQDSTYGKQAYAGEVNYHVASGMRIFGSFSREITSPGHAGLRLGSGGRQIIPDGDAWFMGLGARLSRVDRSINPRSGFHFEMNLETGRKERSERRLVDADTSRQTIVLRQERLESSARVFLPVRTRQVLVFGGDTGVLLSTEYDRSDLFRFGGATSLRGYDEDRFFGRIVGRALVEYRFLIDRLSYAYTFFDLGYVDRPETPDFTATRALHPGYGIGIQFKTAVGLVNVSAALNPDGGPTDARIHAGLSFGL